jgi:site-specific DNA recombinase
MELEGRKSRPRLQLSVKSQRSWLSRNAYAAVLEQVRGLIDRVVVHPAREGGGPEIELIGEITSMIDLALGRHDVHDRRHGGGDRDLFDCSVKVVAGIGFEPMTFRL